MSGERPVQGVSDIVMGMAAFVEHRRMTVDEFERYCDDHPDERLELIDGEIYTVPPESEYHADTAELIAGALRNRYPEPMRVRIVGSIRLDDGSLWEPDVYVYTPDVDRDQAIDKYPHASEVALVIEVSIHTSTRDMGGKYLGYARSGIPEYWVVDPRPGRGVFHRFTDPADGTYRTVESTPLPDGVRSLRL